MNLFLRSKEYPNYSKEQVINFIKEYLKECKEQIHEDNFNNEDFDSPSWQLRQAANIGQLKFIKKLEKFLPK